MVDLVYKQMPICSGQMIIASINHLCREKQQPHTSRRDAPSTLEIFRIHRNNLIVRDFQPVEGVSLSVGRPFYDAVVKRLVPWINGVHGCNCSGFEEVYSMIVTE